MATTYKLLGKVETSQSTLSITNKALTSNVATITTSSSHNFIVGQTVSIILDTSDASFDGVHIITSSPSSTTFTFESINSNVSSVAATGDATGFEWNNMYTCPSSTSSVVTSLVITNKNTHGVYYQIAICDSESVSGEDYIVYNDLMAGYETISLAMGITLDDVEKNIMVCAGDSNVTFNAFGMEITA